MKKYLFLATAAIAALASCTSDDFVGDKTAVTSQNENGAISFGTGVDVTTRADITGSAAAGALNKNFVVEGYKWNGSGDKTIVFDNYNVNWKENTKNTTTSNTNDWEYVGQDKHANAKIEAQTIKYWDYAKSQYDFIAYSTGGATFTSATPTTGELKVIGIDITKMAGVKTAEKITDGAYTIEGAAADLKKAYIADMVTIKRDKNDANDALGDYNKAVQFKFRSLSAKVRIALYETVPGYSVKDVKFYSADDDATPNTTASLYTKSTDKFYANGKYIVYFPTTGDAAKTDNNKAHVVFEPATNGGTSTILNLSTLNSDKFVTKELKEIVGTEKIFLGRNSTVATYAGTASPDNFYTVVLPNEDGVVLNLKVDYTLVSTDGSGETINVTGATAKVPNIYAAWKSGYAYTYLFKISQNTNGLTNPSITDKAGLYPITFDAVVMNDEVDGTQETITTVSNPSITTYAKGTVVTDNNEYKKESNIYVVVDGTPVELTVGTNAKLYTVTLEDEAAQTINEASVANAIAKGIYNSTAKTYTVTDKNDKNMVVTESSLLSAVTEIAAADSPTGNAITVNGAKFTPSAAGTYVFEYINGTNKYYKIIKVVE